MNLPFKGVLICLLLVLPFCSSAKFGWQIHSAYALYGIYLNPPAGWIHTVEVGYDFSRKSCLSRPTLDGIGMVAGFGNNFRELGIKTFFNPTRKLIGISRKIWFNPYLFAQANWRVQTPSESQMSSGSARLGLGFAGMFFSNAAVPIRTHLQVGYSIADYKEPVLHGIVAEFKVGFAINTRRVRKQKSEDQLSS